MFGSQEAGRRLRHSFVKKTPRLLGNRGVPKRGDMLAKT
jgi:hypothetical protein